jgi:hypothetical protein
LGWSPKKAARGVDGSIQTGTEGWFIAGAIVSCTLQTTIYPGLVVTLQSIAWWWNGSSEESFLDQKLFGTGMEISKTTNRPIWKFFNQKLTENKGFRQAIWKQHPTIHLSTKRLRAVFSFKPLATAYPKTPPEAPRAPRTTSARNRACDRPPTDTVYG